MELGDIEETSTESEDNFELYGCDTVQDRVDLDYNGGHPSYEDNK